MSPALPEEALASIATAWWWAKRKGSGPACCGISTRQSLQPIYRHENGFPRLEHLPTPDWELYRDKNYLPVHFVETTRGCPLDCEFCAVTTAFGGQVPQPPAR